MERKSKPRIKGTNAISYRYLLKLCKIFDAQCFYTQCLLHKGSVVL